MLLPNWILRFGKLLWRRDVKLDLVLT
jgi:hypothetical protein